MAAAWPGTRVRVRSGQPKEQRKRRTMIARPHSIEANPRQRGCDGVAAIEFAAIAPILLVLLTGVGEVGIAAHQRLQVEAAAEAGALYAVRHGDVDLTAIGTAVVNGTRYLRHLGDTGASEILRLPHHQRRGVPRRRLHDSLSGHQAAGPLRDGECHDHASDLAALPQPGDRDVGGQFNHQGEIGHARQQARCDSSGIRHRPAGFFDVRPRTDRLQPPDLELRDVVTGRRGRRTLRGGQYGLLRLGNGYHDLRGRPGVGLGAAPVFTVTSPTPACGQQVNGTLTFTFIIPWFYGTEPVGNAMTLNATACYPS